MCQSPHHIDDDDVLDCAQQSKVPYERQTSRGGIDFQLGVRRCRDLGPCQNHLRGFPVGGGLGESHLAAGSQHIGVGDFIAGPCLAHTHRQVHVRPLCPLVDQRACRCGFQRWTVLRFGERGVGLRKRDGGELNIRTGDLCPRRRFSPMARYFCYLTDNLRAPVL